MTPAKCATDTAANQGRRPNANLSKTVAELVSSIFSPPVVAAVTIWLAARRLGAAHPRASTLVFILLGIAVPALYLLWLVRRGLVTDMDVSQREQRKRPMLVMVACSVVAWLLLWLLDAGRPTLILAGAMTVQAALMLAVTLRWKISQHSAMSAWAGRLGWLLLGTPLPLLIMPLLVWSRIRLGRHTPAEAGALLGLAMSSAAVWLTRMG